MIYLEYEPEKGDTLEDRLPKNVFIKQFKHQTEPLNMIQNVFQNDFMNFNGSLKNDNNLGKICSKSLTIGPKE